MNKYRTTILIALCAVSVACNVKEDDYITKADNVVFYASNGDYPSSKTVLQSDGTIKWKPQDRINIFHGSSSFEFVSTNTEDASEVEFHGSLDGIDYTDGNEFWAVYPYNNDHSFDGTSITVSLPHNQVAISGSFDDDLFISIARTQDYNLQFYNVCGGVRFTVVQDGVKSVIFKGNNSEPLAGTAKVAFGSNGKPVIKEMVSEETEITVTAPGQTTFEKGKWYYIVCYPSILSKGYSLRLVNQDGTTADKKNSSDIEIKRAIWGSLEESDKNLAYGIPNDEIWYTTTDGQVLYPTQRNSWGRTILSNTYSDGKGIIKFSGPITEVPYSAYYYNSLSGGRLQTISLPNSITSISSQAFYQCNNLVTVGMSSELTSIGSKAFYRCGKLQSLVIPEKVTSIGVDVFTDCYGMEELTILSNSKNFGDDRGYGYVINNARYISRFYGPNVTEDGRYIIIDNCVMLAAGKDLKSASIPDGIIEIGPYAFRGCTQLQSIELPNSLQTLSQSCFYGCSSLSDIQLPNGLSSIGYDAFYNCTSLKHISIPNNVESISSFSNCTSLESVIMRGVKTIYASAFENCKSLSDIQFGDNLTNIYSRAFSGCESITHFTIPNSLVYLATDAISGCPITSLEVLSSATAFDTSFGSKSRYASCMPRNKLTEITGPFARENNSMLIIDGVLLLATIQNRESVRIPADVTTISESVFNNASSLKDVVISPKVTTIDNQAFRNCPLLEKVVVLADNPPSITSSSFFNYGAGLDNGSTYPFYVPTQSVDKYKSASIWSEYAERIYPSDKSSSYYYIEPVDLGLSVKWASCNLGANDPHEHGDYYAWGETEPYYNSLDPLQWKDGKSAGYTWTSYTWCNGSDTSLTKYYFNTSWGNYENPDNKIDLSDYDFIDDAARQKLGGNWRLPTTEEWQELYDNCTWKWTYSPVCGRIITSNVPGYTDKSIFLPASGGFRNTTLESKGYYGNYWASSVHPDAPSTARYIYFWNNGVDVTRQNSRYNGISIRPVTE